MDDIDEKKGLDDTAVFSNEVAHGHDLQ